MNKRNWLLIAVVLLGIAACDRNIEPYVPGEMPREPDLSRIFPAPEPGAAPAGNAMGEAPTPGPQGTPQTGRAGAAVRGTVRIASGTNGPGAGAVLFVIARSRGAAGGPPLAVLRVDDPSFPLDFEIGPANVMIPSMSFEGPISLTARLDSDGNATTRAEGDLAIDSPIDTAPGSVGVELLLQ